MRLEILTAGTLLTVASTARSIITRCATTLYFGQFLFAWTAYGINGVNLITQNALDGFITLSCLSTPLASWQTIPEDDTNQTRNTSVSLHFWRSSDGKPLPWIWMDNERPHGRVWMLIGGGGVVVVGDTLRPEPGQEGVVPQLTRLNNSTLSWSEQSRNFYTALYWGLNVQIYIDVLRARAAVGWC